MKNFDVYTFQFTPKTKIDHPYLFDDINQKRKEIMGKKNEALSEILDSVDFVHRGKKLSLNKICTSEDVFVFKIANKKTRKREKNFVEEIEDNEPSSYVIIYNDPLVQRILIEDKKDSFADTSVLSGILRKAMNAFLICYNLEIVIRQEYYAYEFWHILKRHEEPIQMIRFEFDYPNLPRVNEYIDDVLKSTGREINSTKSKLEYASEDMLVLDEQKDDSQVNKLIKGAANGGNPVVFKLKGVRKLMKTGNRVKKINIDELYFRGKDISELKDVIRSISDE